VTHTITFRACSGGGGGGGFLSLGSDAMSM
jgi:hypothetical protein